MLKGQPENASAAGVESDGVGWGGVAVEFREAGAGHRALGLWQDLNCGSELGW